MVDFVKRFIHVILAIAVAYYGYSAMETPPKKMGDGGKLPKITQASLRHRAPDEVLERPGDPYFRDWAPYGPEYAPEAIARRKQAEQTEQDRLIKEARDRQAKLRAEQAKAREKQRHTEEEQAVEPFTLSLDAVLDVPSGASALISGHTLRVGESIKQFDKYAPPTLVEIAGTSAAIEYRGKRYTLDITAQRSVLVGREHLAKKEPDTPKADPPVDERETPAEKTKPVKPAATPAPGGPAPTTKPPSEATPSK